MAKKGSSNRWIHEHLTDEYVKKAQKEGYRSRSVYKLIEIIDKKKLSIRVIKFLTWEQLLADGLKWRRKQ